MNTAENRAHWDARAGLGETAGTQDRILVALEQRALLNNIPLTRSEVYWRALELGCGTGDTARLLSKSGLLITDAIDSSPQMIAVAAGEPRVGCVSYAVMDAMCPPLGPYHLIYSQRCLINLPTWEAQRQALDAIAARLVPGGQYLMCESSQDGLDAINATRIGIGLHAITPPWHTRYFVDADLATITSLRLVRCEHFSATYYYHSRVLNAALAAQEGREPAYDAPINQLALQLTDTVDPSYAQSRLWIWEKA